MQCVILVGGLGTRLGALTVGTPKPMLPVAGVPFLRRLVDDVARFGFDEVILLAGYRADAVRAHFATARCAVRVHVITEADPLGTGGALRAAARKLAPSFLLSNGDSWFDFNLLDLATGDWPAAVRMALRHVPDPARFGVVDLAANGRIALMRERPDRPGPGLINAGVYWADRDVLLGAIPESCPSSLEREALPALAAGGLLAGRAYDGAFIDIGVTDELERAQGVFPVRRGAVFFDRDGTLNHDPGHTHRIETFRWIEGAVEAIRAVNDAGLFAFVITNQSGVARGLYAEDDVLSLHSWMAERMRDSGAHVDAFSFCPHHLEGAVPRYRRPCRCRKPAPGMIEDLLEAWPVDPARSLVVGDSPTDMAAAAAAGLRGALFCGGRLDAFLVRTASDLLRSDSAGERDRAAAQRPGIAPESLELGKLERRGLDHPGLADSCARPPDDAAASGGLDHGSDPRSAAPPVRCGPEADLPKCRLHLPKEAG
jgi:D,D-heptose 1,7-bisphosphate phosphatase